MAELDSQSVDQASALKEEMDLVERAKTDEAAFETLYHRYFNRIYGYIFKRTGQHEITEDIVSATFMKVFLHLKKYQPQGYSFSAWIYRIATNELIDHYRKSGRQGTADIESIAEPVDPQQSPEQFVEHHFTQDMIQKVLAEMSARDQEIIQLKYFAELSNGEVATILNISANNAGVMIHRALKRFHDIYQKYAQ